MKIVATNRKVSHDYFILETLEAGIRLTGTEIKSIRNNNVNINDAFIQIRNGQCLIINMHIAKYEQGNIFNHDETRTRVLLIHKKEAIKLLTKSKLDGNTIIPTKVYFKDALCKVELALCKGKQLHDKRQALKEADAKRHIQKTIKQLNNYN